MLEVIKRKDGVTFVRDRADESGAMPENVHPNKLRAWIAMSKAAHEKGYGKPFEDSLKAVSDEMKGKRYSEDKGKRKVTQKQYDALRLNAAKKKVSKKKLDSMVEIVTDTETIEEKENEKKEDRPEMLEENIVKKAISSIKT